jgi:hypothetical protein
MISILIGTALAAQAQQVTLASAATKQFSDSASGVTFRYPAQWTSSSTPQFYAPLIIASQDEPLRGNVFFSSTQGFNPYPNTNLTGAQFAYSTRKASSAEECLKTILQDDGNAKPLAPKNIHGISYAHAQTGSGGMCHQISEDIYAAFRNQNCYVFDLAVHTICVGVVDNTREITSDELAQVHTSLGKILSSVQISDLKKD